MSTGSSASWQPKDLGARVEMALGVAAALVGLASIGFLAPRVSFQGWKDGVYLAAIVLAALGTAAGAHRHVIQRTPGGVALLWLSLLVAVVGATWSALSPPLVAIGTVALAAAAIGTLRDIRS